MLLSPRQLSPQQPNNMKYLGIDFGLRKIGLATGDDVTGLAFALGNIDGGVDAIKAILDRANAEGVDALVIGLPIPDAHQKETQLELTKTFVQNVQNSTTTPVFVVDEQFTSAEARRLQKEYPSDMPEDAIAATILLQAFLDGDRDLTLDTAQRREE